MEHYSPKLRVLLGQVARAWVLERRNEDELCFTSATLKIKTGGEEQSWTHAELLAEVSLDLVEQCLAELEDPITATVESPFYSDKSEDFRFITW